MKTVFQMWILLVHLKWAWWVAWWSTWSGWRGWGGWSVGWLECGVVGAAAGRSGWWTGWGDSVEWMECALLRAALRVHLALAGGQRAGANVPLDPFPSFSGGKVIAGVEKLRCTLPQGFIQALEFSI